MIFFGNILYIYLKKNISFFVTFFYLKYWIYIESIVRCTVVNYIFQNLEGKILARVQNYLSHVYRTIFFDTGGGGGLKAILYIFRTLNRWVSQRKEITQRNKKKNTESKQYFSPLGCKVEFYSSSARILCVKFNF